MSRDAIRKFCPSAILVRRPALKTSTSLSREIAQHVNDLKVLIFAAGNAGDAANTGGAKTSKITSKNQPASQVVDNTYVTDQKKDFGVAIGNIFSLGNQWSTSRLNTPYTHAFWTPRTFVSDASGRVTASPLHALKHSEAMLEPNRNLKRKRMNEYFSLRRKKSCATWQATFCYLGHVHHFGTGESDLLRAHAKSQAEQPRILGVIKARIENEMEVAESYKSARAKGCVVAAAPGQPNPINFKTPPPTGSFREKIEEERSFIVNSFRSRSRKREVREAEAHLYEALGADVDLPVSKMDQTTGARAGAYFSNRDRFPLSGPHYARCLRRLFLPIVQRGELNQEFLAAFDRVSKGVKFSK